MSAVAQWSAIGSSTVQSHWFAADSDASNLAGMTKLVQTIQKKIKLDLDKVLVFRFSLDSG